MIFYFHIFETGSIAIVSPEIYGFWGTVSSEKIQKAENFKLNPSRGEGLL